MEEDSSIEIITVEIEETQDFLPATTENMADRPLIQFFKRLLLNNSSQNTILTNAQLEDILIKEFNCDLVSQHPLQVDIYVNVLKKYLKDWPLWDEFETIAKNLTECSENSVAFKNVLETRYKFLRIYLQKNLDMAKELSKKVIRKELISEKRAEKKKQILLSSAEEPKGLDSSPVVLEIQATRDQLNKLIYNQPHRSFNNTIFNIEDKTPPSHIRLNTLSLEAILNWWSVRITISLHPNSFFLMRETTHELEHLLVNRQKSHKETSSVGSLDQVIQIKDAKKGKNSSMKTIMKKQILSCLDLLATKHDAAVEGMEIIINHVRVDLERMNNIVAPATYRRYLCEYPYVRYLYSEVETATIADKTSYDIQLKETISPMHQFSIGRLDVTLENSLPSQWLKVECVKCNVTCTGENLSMELKQHFDEYHQPEPDWECTNCLKSYAMADLAEHWWIHKCS